MKKLKVFASGWFSMDGVVQNLVNDGHEVWTSYKCNVEGTNFLDFGIEPFGPGHEEFEHYIELAKFLMQGISVGGRPVATSEHAFPTLASWSIAASWRRRFILKAMDNLGDVDLVIVHNDYDPTFGVVTLWAQKRGIPVFCPYNGFSSYLHPRVTGMLDYKMGAYYCLHGQYVLDYLNVRQPIMAEAVLTGSPAFDEFYTNTVDREPNTFLYNITTNYQEAEDRDNFFAHPTAIHPWTFHFRPAKIDRVFLEGFAVYQKTVNPEAKLVLTLRPFHLLGYSAQYIMNSYDIKNVEVYTSDEKPFRKLVQRCEYFAGGISTTIQEAIVTRTPTVFMCGTEPMEDFFQSRDCYVETIIDVNAIVEALDFVTKNKEELIKACEDRAEYYNYKDDGKASDRVTNYIYDVVNRS
jgi:hypothetical protein